MSTPKLNATPKEMAALAKLNKSLYGTKPEIGPGKSMAGGNVGTAITSMATNPKRPEPPRPTPKPELTRPTPMPEPTRPMPMPKPEPMPPMEPRRPTPMPTPDPGSMPTPLRPTGKPSNQMEYKKGGSVPSASKRADGIAQRGKTRGKMC